MKFIQCSGENNWWEWDTKNMLAYNYFGEHYNIDENALGDAKYIECDSWRDLYLRTHWSPIESDIWEKTAWLSPNGKFIAAKAHEVTAEDICEIYYGENQGILWAGDYLEERGWVRLTTSLMWDVRDSYWFDKDLTQKQLDMLWDWCELHNKVYPF